MAAMFICGAGLAICGAILQSLLRNPIRMLMAGIICGGVQPSRERVHRNELVRVTTDAGGLLGRGDGSELADGAADVADGRGKREAHVAREVVRREALKEFRHCL